MTTSLRVQATVTADGKQASVELTNLVGKVADARIAVDDQKAAVKRLSAELKTLNRDTAEGATRAAQIRDEMRAAKIAMIEQTAAAAGAARQMTALSQAGSGVAASAGQQRAAMTNLGQQLGDIAQGYAAGIAPAVIFAQQSGQVAFALSGLGGKAAGVAAFLGGPWGIGLTTAAVALSPFVAKLFESEKASDAGTEALKRQKQALEEYDRLIGRAADSQEKQIDRQVREAAARLKAAEATRIQIRAKLDDAIAELQVTKARSGAGAGTRGEVASLGLQNAAGNIVDLQRQRGENEKAIGTDQARIRSGQALLGLARVKEATDAAAAANGRYERTEKSLFEQRSRGAISQAQYEGQLTAATKARDAALAAAGEATKAARTAQTEQNRELRDGAAAAKEQADALNKMRIAGDRFYSDLAASQPSDAEFITGVGRIYKASQTDRTGVDGLVSDAEKRRPELSEIQGRYTAQGFRDQALTDAVAIGRAIGGTAGDAFQSIAGLAQGAKNGDFNGVPGPIGGILTLLSGSGREGGSNSPFSAGLKEAVSAPLGGLKDAFKNVFSSESGQQFAKFAGRAAGGAAVGGTVASIGNAIGLKLDSNGAKVGGAVGSALGPAISKLGSIGAALGPFAGIIGGIAGGLIGGLLAPKGSTTISATGGKISSVGTGNAAVQKATGAIGNTVTDALQSIADQLGGTIGDFSVSIGKKKGQFRVDSSGSGKLNGSTVTGTDSESEALTLALADALRDGGVKVSSPRVQAALTAYADNVNKAVAEALKVKGLEDQLADRKNPFLSTFRALESQLKQRLDIAQKYGFDLVEIERINGEDRAKALKDTLASATGSVRSLLTELTIGSRATGSPVERLAGLTKERDRLTALAKGGDLGQLDAIAAIVQQIDDLQKSTFGATGGFANGRADSIAQLNDLLKLADDKAKAAADEVRATGKATVDKLTEANASLDDQVALLTRNNALLAQIAAGLAGGGSGSFNFGLAASEVRG